MGGLDIVITGLVLGVIRIAEAESEAEYYPRVAETVVDIFFNGVRGGNAT